MEEGSRASPRRGIGVKEGLTQRSRRWRARRVRCLSLFLLTEVEDSRFALVGWAFAIVTGRR